MEAVIIFESRELFRSMFGRVHGVMKARKLTGLIVLSSNSKGRNVGAVYVCFRCHEYHFHAFVA